MARDEHLTDKGGIVMRNLHEDYRFWEEKISSGGWCAPEDDLPKGGWRGPESSIPEGGWRKIKKTPAI